MGKHFDRRPRRQQHKFQKQRRGRKAPPVPARGIKFTPEEIAQLQTALGCGNAWDLILLGDGSAGRGTGICGWGVTLYDRVRGTKHTFFGALSGGSSLIAETIPYLHAMLWYDQFRGKARRRHAPEEPIRVLIVTDAQSLVRHSKKVRFTEPNPEKAHAVSYLMSILHQLEDAGYEFDWIWRGRGVLTANKDMNLLAQAARWKLITQEEPEDED